MPNWGFIDNATATAPLDVLAELLATRHANAREKFKDEGDLLDRSVKASDAGVRVGDLKLRESTRNDALSKEQKDEQNFQNLISEAQAKAPWMVPVLKAQRYGKVNVSPEDATVSPEQQRAQKAADEATKASTALKNAQALKGAPEYSDLHPKPVATEPDLFAGVGGGNPASPHTSSAPAMPTRAATGGFDIRSARPISSHGTGAPSQPAPVNAPAQTGKNESFLQSLPPDLASRVKAIDSGQYPVPTGKALADPIVRRDFDLARRYDPSLELLNYGNRAATQKAFTTGSQGNTKSDLNAVIGHIAALDSGIEGLNNFGGAIGLPLNWVKNNVLRGGASQDPKLKSFDVNANLASDELSRVYTGAGGARGDREDMRGQFGMNDSPESLRAAIGKSLELLTSKLKSKDTQYAQGMGGNRIMLDMLDPDVRKTYEELMKKYGLLEGASAPNVVRYDINGQVIK